MTGEGGRGSGVAVPCYRSEGYSRCRTVVEHSSQSHPVPAGRVITIHSLALLSSVHGKNMSGSGTIIHNGDLSEV